MPYGQSSYVSLADFSTGYVERLTLVGRVKFCVRPPAASPNWVLIASDIGEIRVFNNAGVHQPDYDINLGWNPDQVTINNEDPPKILVARLSNSGLYLYESGSLSWSVIPVSFMIEAVISDSWVHTLIWRDNVAASCGAQWRSLTDGSIVQDVRGIPSGTYDAPLSGLCATEGGEIVYYQFWYYGGAALRRPYIRKEDRTAGIVWQLWPYQDSNSQILYNTACSADGSLVGLTFHRVSTGGTYFYLRRGSDGYVLAVFSIVGVNTISMNVNPAGTRAVCLYGTTLRKYDAIGNPTIGTIGATRAVNDWCCDVTDDPYFVAALQNGDVEIYDDDLVKKATISYELSDTPMAVIRRT